MSPAEIHRLQIDHALRVLLDEQAWTQAEVEKKLKILGCNISRPSLSNLYNKKSTVSLKLLKSAASGLSTLLRKEYCLEWIASSFAKIKDCQPNPVWIEAETTLAAPPASVKGETIHDGRLNVSDKVAFYQRAKMEIIEIGIRLNNFASYFEKKRESAFKAPLHQLLEDGVNVKCYILDPAAGGFARKYLDDRARMQLSEKDTLNSLPDSLASLRDRFIRINKSGYEGKMELYTYPHFPYFHATAIDLNTERGALYISPYLYGISRANTPVIEVSHQSNKLLYKKYARSISAITRDANQRV